MRARGPEFANVPYIGDPAVPRITTGADAGGCALRAKSKSQIHDTWRTRKFFREPAAKSTASSSRRLFADSSGIDGNFP